VRSTRKPGRRPIARTRYVPAKIRIAVSNPYCRTESPGAFSPPRWQLPAAIAPSGDAAGQSCASRTMWQGM
jgi:hypothetical protein